MANHAAPSDHDRNAKAVIADAHPLLETRGERHGFVFIENQRFNNHAGRGGDGMIGVTL